MGIKLMLPIGLSLIAVAYYNWKHPYNTFKLIRSSIFKRLKTIKAKIKNEIVVESNESKKRNVTSNQYVIGIDVGATGIGVCVVFINQNAERVINYHRLIKEFDVNITNDDKIEYQNIISKLGGIINQSLAYIQEDKARNSEKNYKNLLVGIGIPGLIDSEKGIVKKASNFSNWPENLNVLKLLRNNFPNISFYLENDANCGLLGEIWKGALSNASNISHAVMMSLGSGIGGAVFSNGKVLRGSSGMLGEIGHMIVHANGRYHEATGVHGVLESYSSAFAILEQAKKRISSSISNAKEVFDLAFDENDDIAKNIISEAANYIGIGLINVCRFYDPQVIIIAGGLSLAGDRFIDLIKESFHKNHWKIQKPQCIIVVSTLGDKAGMYGAAYNAIIESN